MNILQIEEKIYVKYAIKILFTIKIQYRIANDDGAITSGWNRHVPISYGDKIIVLAYNWKLLQLKHTKLHSKIFKI